MNYKKQAEGSTRIDLREVGNYYFVDWDMLDDETIERLEADGYEEEMDVTMNEIDEYNIPFVAVDMSFGYWDEDDARFMLSQYIKGADHYLVFANGCRWDGASGYKFADDIVDTIYRDYDVTIYPKTATKGGKTLVCTEHSHDVPMGARTTIIALTDNEYERLVNSEWDVVRRFAKKQEDKALEM